MVRVARSGNQFLPRDTQAEWIVFPAQLIRVAHWFTGLDATFRRELF